MSGPLHQGLSRLKHDPQIGLRLGRPRFFLERCRPRSHCGGAREATLCLWISLYEELVLGWGCSRPAAPKTIERRGRNHWNAATCLRASWYLSTTESTASPNRPEGASGASIRKTLSFSFISDMVNHKCLSAATNAAMDRPMARAVSLVARRTKSAVLLSSPTSLELICSPSSSSFSRSAWYACSTAIVWRHAPAWPAAVYPLPTSTDYTCCGLVGKTGAFRDDAAPGDR